MNKEQQHGDHCPHGHHHHAHQEIGFAFWLNFIFAGIELVGGLYVNSVSILSDALHDFGDALFLAVAWMLEKKSLKMTDEQFSYGYRRYSTISTLLTSLVLILGSCLILVQSLPRLLNPVQPETNGMILLAVLGFAVNGIVVLRMRNGKSLNERALTWHFIEDLLGWGLILLSAVVMKFVHVPILDPLIAILISFFVIRNVWKSFQEAMAIFLQATPARVQVESIKKHLRSYSFLFDVHHLHVWSLDGEKHILTAHLVLKSGQMLDQLPTLKAQIKKDLEIKFQIQEATLEFEVQGEICHDPQHREVK